MLALLQRVNFAKVEVAEKEIAAINNGLLVFLAIEPNDTEKEADRLLNKILNYRVFADDNGLMNLSLTKTDGDLLLVSQFTLAADTKKGMRPSFSSAAEPKISKNLVDYMISQAKKLHKKTFSGEFGADMQVTLCNDGPVTFLLR